MNASVRLDDAAVDAAVLSVHGDDRGGAGGDADEAWIVLLATPSGDQAVRIPAGAPANDAGVPDDEALLGCDDEYLTRCAAGRDAWIEAMECDASDADATDDRSGT